MCICNKRIVAVAKRRTLENDSPVDFQLLYGFSAVHAVFGDFAVAYANDTVSHLRYAFVVRNKQYRCAVLCVYVLQKLQNVARGLGIERARRLVAQQHGGILYDSAGNGAALLLSSRKLRGEVSGVPFKPKLLKQLVNGQGRNGNVAYHLYVLAHGKLRDKVVGLENNAYFFAAVFQKLLFGKRGNRAAVHGNAALVGAVKPAEHIKQRAFARA